jgi:hypothetical protein
VTVLKRERPDDENFSSEVNRVHMDLGSKILQTFENQDSVGMIHTHYECSMSVLLYECCSVPPTPRRMVWRVMEVLEECCRDFRAVPARCSADETEV